MAMTKERLDIFKAHAANLREAILPDWADIVEELIAEVSDPTTPRNMKLTAMRESARKAFVELDPLIRMCLAQVESDYRKKEAISTMANIIANQIWCDHQEAESDRKRISKSRRKVVRPVSLTEV